MEEISGTNVTFFRTNPKETRLSTIVIRGATPNILDDVERAIDDGVNVYKVGCCYSVKIVIQKKKKNDFDHISHSYPSF